MIDLQWFRWMRKITLEFERQKDDEFSFHDQLAQILKEIVEIIESTEFFFDLNLNKKETLGEIYDLIFSGFTLMHVLGYSDEEMYEGLQETIAKLNHRAETNYYVEKATT